MSRLPRHARLANPIPALALVGVVALLCSASPVRAGGIDANAKALAQLDDEWSKAAGTKDAERVASFYAEDAIAYPPNAPAAVGRAAAKKVWAAYFADPSFKISWKTTHAGISGELGFTAGTYEDSFKGPDGKLVTEKGKYVCTWKKDKGGAWKAIHDIWNTDAK